MTIRYQGTLVCSLNVSNLERSIEFYRNGLGFEEIYRLAEYGWCELRSPVERVTVGLQQAKEGYGPGGATLAFTVDDIRAAKAHLESLGTRFDGHIVVIPGDEGVELANFTDPDGNPLTLAQPNRPVARP